MKYSQQLQRGRFIKNNLKQSKKLELDKGEEYESIVIENDINEQNTVSTAKTIKSMFLFQNAKQRFINKTQASEVEQSLSVRQATESFFKKNDKVFKIRDYKTIKSLSPQSLNEQIFGNEKSKVLSRPKSKVDINVKSKQTEIQKQAYLSSLSKLCELKSSNIFKHSTFHHNGKDLAKISVQTMKEKTTTPSLTNKMFKTYCEIDKTRQMVSSVHNVQKQPSKVKINTIQNIIRSSNSLHVSLQQQIQIHKEKLQNLITQQAKI